MSKRIKLQLVLIYGIIIAAFLGSALLFSYLNTRAMMTAVEKETDLAAAILTSDIHTRLQPSTDMREELAKELDERLSRALDDVGVVIDVWAVDSAGSIVYARGDDFPMEEWKATEPAKLGNFTSSMRWIGPNNPFLLDQSLYLTRRMSSGNLYLVALNYCSAIRAVQRSQFTLFISIELILILTMIVLLTNTISHYRQLLIQLATTDELT
ncbi:MAG: hypothetical protein ACSW8J_10180, partial [bacterium]